MPDNIEDTISTSAMRRMAETKVASRKAISEASLGRLNVKRLLHEFQVQHEELKMQNEELLQAKFDLQRGNSILEERVADRTKELTHEKSKLQQKITELIRMDKALHDSELRYRAVVEDQTEIISRYRPDGTLTFVNDIYSRLFGKNSEELLGTSWQPGAFPEDLPLIESRLKEMTPTNPIVAIENRVCVFSGEVRWMQFVNRGFYDDNGQLIETQSVGRDITDRKLVENEQRESEERYRTLFELESDAIVVIDRDTCQIMDVNKAAVEMFGYSKDELLQLKVFDLSAEQQQTELAIAQSQTSIPLRWVCKKDGTQFPVEITNSNFEYQGRFVHVSALRNITDRKRNEEQLIELNEKLRTLSEHLQNIQEQERLSIARDIHDDIGQQLTSLKLDITWIENHLATDGKELGDRLKQMGSSVDLLVSSVQRIASELRPPLLDTMGMVAAIEWQVSEFTKHSGIECVLMLNEDANPQDKLIATSVVRIVQEALTNVARHAGATEVGISLCKNSDGLLLEILDNGRGISEQEIAAKNSYGLLGMRERALLCGGELTITDTSGAGTNIRIMIPSMEGKQNHEKNSDRR